MKALSRIVLASVMLAVMMMPLASLSDQLPAPLTKTVFPPQETIYYAGQTLKFTTEVPLKVNLLALEPGRVQLKFSAAPSSFGGNRVPAATIIQVYWENWDNEIYSGDPPVTEPWEGILLTESGFTEK